MEKIRIFQDQKVRTHWDAERCLGHREALTGQTLLLMKQQLLINLYY